MAGFWKSVNNVIMQADILLLVMDARFIAETRNREIEDKAIKSGKPLIYVINKIDLGSAKGMSDAKKAMNPCVMVSTKRRKGVYDLKARIMIEAKRFTMKRGKIRVGVLGYPNVGKSSLINMMKGRKSTSTSPLSGITKTKQVVKTSSRLYFIDTPGVKPYFEKDQLKFMFTNVTDYSKIKDPETMAERLMEKFPGKIEQFYGVPVNDDKRDTLEAIAVKKHVLKKGGHPDTRRMAVTIIMNWQKGKL